MKHGAKIAAFVVFSLLACSWGCSADQQPQPTVRLGKLPTINLIAGPEATEVQIQHIKALIASLTKLDKPDFGLSATLSGSDFAPVPGQGHAAAMLLTNHGLATASALNELVAIGPDALPHLLESLDDQTPTRIVIDHETHFGAMWFDREVGANPVDPAEKGVLPAAGDPMVASPGIDSYTVKVGDVCFVAIGQIVGRGYQAVRYQPTACIVINSPTHDPKLCAEVKAVLEVG